MLDIGTVKPGSTIRIPFSTFDKDDGSSITMTNFAAADILVYKDGGTTERASTSGYTATTDFDTKTGKQLIVIDLADNTTAGFWNAGSEYLVAIDAVTVDAVTVGGWVARFRIGYVGAILDTTIATLSSQTSFTLTSGPAEDDALNGRMVIIHDIASAVQVGQAVILDYTGSTKTVTLAAGTTFTAAAGDNISVMELAPLTPTVSGRTLDVSTGGEAGVDWANVGTPGSTVNLSATTVNLVNTLTTYTGNTPQTGDSYAIVNSGVHGNAAIKGYVDDIGVAGAGLTALGDARLANLDATVSSRLASAGYTAPPSAATNASAVRTELTTELGRIDVAISSRLSTVGYTTPPTATAIADAVLTRDVSNVEGTAGDHSLCYVVLASSEWSVSGTVLTVKKTDGTTFASKTLTKTTGDDPVRGIA